MKLVVHTGSLHLNLLSVTTENYMRSAKNWAKNKLESCNQHIASVDVKFRIRDRHGKRALKIKPILKPLGALSETFGHRITATWFRKALKTYLEISFQHDQGLLLFGAVPLPKGTPSVNTQRARAKQCTRRKLVWTETSKTWWFGRHVRGGTIWAKWNGSHTIANACKPNDGAVPKELHLGILKQA